MSSSTAELYPCLARLAARAASAEVAFLGDDDAVAPLLLGARDRGFHRVQETVGRVFGPRGVDGYAAAHGDVFLRGAGMMDLLLAHAVCDGGGMLDHVIRRRAVHEHDDAGAFPAPHHVAAAAERAGDRACHALDDG